MTTLPKSFPWKYFFERLKKFIQRKFLESGLEFWENWALFTAEAFSGAYHLKHLRKGILECSYRLIKNGSEDHRKVFFRLYHVNLRVNQSARGPKISPYSSLANAVALGRWTLTFKWQTNAKIGPKMTRNLKFDTRPEIFYSIFFCFTDHYGL